MKLPDRKTSEVYFVLYKVPKNIIMHCKKVNEVAIFLAKRLKDAGEDINMDVVDRLSLLHDLFKAVVIKNLSTDPLFKFSPTEEEVTFWKKMQKKYNDMHETAMFCSIFQGDFPEFCTLMKSYGGHDYNILTSQKSREEQIVHYADWRVFVDKIIPLKQRMDDLFIRYNKKITDAGIDFWKRRVEDEFLVERDICNNINIDPLDLAIIMGE